MLDGWMISDPSFVLEAGLTTLYGAMSIGATIHILLNKSDPKAALLWIALVWFSPIFGVCFYLLFGINRISRRANKLAADREVEVQKYLEIPENTEIDHLWDSFRNLSRNVSRSGTATGNSVNIIEGVETIHRSMITDIRRSKSAILMSTYIFRRDDLGREIADALVEADQRGVNVKVLLDGVGNGFFRSRVFRQLKTGGVDTRRFLHSIWPWRMPFLNLRNHRKLLIIDGQTAYTGSMNIGRVVNWETQFKIDGPFAADLTAAFEQDWILAGGGTLGPDFREPFHIRPGSIELRAVKSGPIYRKERLRWVLLGVMGAASHHIRIVTPYFIPDRGLLSGLILAALRGVRVEVILPQRSNYAFADWASNRQIKQLVEAGCEIFYRNDIFDHSKIMTVDGRWALIGSSNWDARSLRLNFELDVECFNQDFVGSLDAIIDQKNSKSTLISQAEIKKRPLLIRLRNALARLLLPYL